MNDMKQPEALRLARELEGVYPVNIQDQEAAAAELRRLHELNDELLKALNDYRAKARGMTVQRDELVEAANDALELLALIHDEHGKVGKKLRAAIAKATEATTPAQRLQEWGLLAPKPAVVERPQAEQEPDAFYEWWSMRPSLTRLQAWLLWKVEHKQPERTHGIGQTAAPQPPKGEPAPGEIR